MAYLHKRGIKAISLSAFEAALSAAQLPNESSVLITFDDGSRSCLTEALPVLAKYGFFGTAFLITGRMRDVSGMHGTYGDTLSWPEARELRDSGFFALQSHSHSHARWPLDESGQNQVAIELGLSRQSLVLEIGSSHGNFSHLAWPWGRCNSAFESIASDLGYAHQYFVQKGAVTHASETLRLPRLCCDGMTTAAFVRWVDALTSPLPALVMTRMSSFVRKWRHGLAYQSVRRDHL